MDERLDAGGREPGPQLVAARVRHHEQMPDVLGLRMHGRQPQPVGGAEAVEVVPGERDPAGVPRVEVPEPHPQQRGLYLVEPAVRPALVVVVLDRRPVVPQPPDALR